MPCNTVSISKVDLGAVHGDTLADYLRSAGWVVQIEAGTIFASKGRERITWAKGQETIVRSNDSAGLLSTVKKGYAGRVLTKNASRFGWRVVPGVNGKITLQR